MSTQIFPSLPGLGWSVKRTPQWKTRVQESISGKETRIADWSFPRWQWELTFEFLRQAGANQQAQSFAGQTYSEFQLLAGFFNARQGMFDSFLYQDADDNAVTGQQFGTGDGTTTVFQLARAFGGFVEPILAPNSIANLYLAGAPIPSGGLLPPAAPALSQGTGGSLAAATYFAKITYVTASGETPPSPETSLAIAASNVLQVASPAAETGAIGYNVYAGTSAGGETLQNTSPIAIGVPWAEPTSGLVAGATPPLTNNTGWSLNAANGQITFSGAPLAGTAISADFSYFFRCRFVEDTMDFEKFMAALYSAKSVKFISLKGA